MFAILGVLAFFGSTFLYTATGEWVWGLIGTYAMFVGIAMQLLRKIFPELGFVWVTIIALLGPLVIVVLIARSWLGIRPYQD